MEYNHKFNIGSVMMDKMIDDYFTLRKTRGVCQKCPFFGQSWSCPNHPMDEKVFLREFKYLYLVGREFTIPKSDRQKTIGIQTCADYCNAVYKQMKLDTWKDMMAFEEAMPDVMTLSPGHCEVCEISGEGCSRSEKQVCRHPDMMRFSFEGLGLDVDAMCKFELGIMLQWPKEGRLPEKMSTVIGICSNERIPTPLLKKYFPEQKRSFVKAGDDRSLEQDTPKAKRVESWLDSQAQAIMEQETDPNYQKKQHWIGFKDESLDSGDYVKNRTWADATFPEPAPDSPWAQQPEDEMQPEVEQPAPGYKRQREVSQPNFDPVEGPLVGPSDEEDNSQYSWLGFKRDADTADELMYSRPIPKFSITPEEKAAQDAAIEFEMKILKGEAVRPEPEMTMTEAAAAELSQPQPEPEPEVPAWRNYTPKPIDYTGMSKKEIMAAEFERALYQKMSRMSDAEAEAFLYEQLGMEPPQRQQQVAHVHGKRRLDPDASPEAVKAAKEQALKDAVQTAREATATRAESAQSRYQDRQPAVEQPKPAPQPVYEPEPEPEPVTLINAGDVDNVLKAALAIANHVTAPPEPEPEPVYEAPAPEPVAASVTTETSGSDAEGEDDSAKYQWLGFKSKVEDDDGFKKGGWKKAY